MLVNITRNLFPYKPLSIDTLVIIFSLWMAHADPNYFSRKDVSLDPNARPSLPLSPPRTYENVSRAVLTSQNCGRIVSTRDHYPDSFSGYWVGVPWHTHQPLNILYISTPGTTYSRLTSVTSCCSCNRSAYQYVRFRRREVSVPQYLCGVYH